MNKFRDLSTYLTNQGIAVLASDHQMYKELKIRRKLGDDVVEVGAVSLPKTANAPPTDAPLTDAPPTVTYKGHKDILLPQGSHLVTQYIQRISLS